MVLAQMDRSAILGSADGAEIPDVQVYAGVDNWTDLMDVLLSLCSFSAKYLLPMFSSFRFWGFSSCLLSPSP